MASILDRVCTLQGTVVHIPTVTLKIEKEKSMIQKVPDR